MSGGRTLTALPSTVVRVVTADGVAGYGEACPLGTRYLPTFAEGARAALRQIAPAVIGVDATDLGAVADAMDAALLGHGYAKSPVDIACWDILGRPTEMPVCALGAESFPLYAAVPLAAAAETAEFVRDRMTDGVRRFQMKLGADPSDDAARTAEVSRLVGDEAIVIADANCGWVLQDAVVAARLLDGLDRVYLEQPCRTLEACVAVRGHTTLPMILDEIILDVPSLIRAVRANALEAFNVKIGRVGGLTNARLLPDRARAGHRRRRRGAWRAALRGRLSDTRPFTRRRAATGAGPPSRPASAGLPAAGGPRGARPVPGPSAQPRPSPQR